MDLSTLALFALTEGFLSLIPGPAVLLVVGLSMRGGFRDGMLAAVGVVSTNAVYFTLSALGIGALILASATLFTVIKWIGAAYLVYLGLTMIAPLLHQGRGGAGVDVAEARSRAAGAPRSASSLVWKGFALQAGNPKNIAFFVAILPQFIDPAGNVPLQLLLLGVVSVLLELPILALYAFAFSTMARLMSRRLILWFEAVAGGILVALGGTLAMSSRR